MKKVWIDTDPGVDDALAIAMLMAARDQVRIVGASSVFGNVDVNQTTRNLRLLAEIGGFPNLPVARGASAPLGVLRESAPFVHGENGLGDMPLPEPRMPLSPLSAPQAIIDAILAAPGEITMLPIGPLTNIAMACLLEPAIIPLVKEVVIMGGAVRCPGNVTPVAEANFYYDPHAAQIVLRAGWPIVLAGLDVMPYGIVPPDLLARIGASSRPLTAFIAGGLPFYVRFSEMADGEGIVYFPDALAAGFLLAPEIFTLEEMRLYVETEGACMGQSVRVHRATWFENADDPRAFLPDSSTGLVRVMTAADTPKFLALLEKLLV